MEDRVKQTTKVCPNCGSTSLVRLRSHNKKFCNDCKTYLDWYLDEGQEPLDGKRDPDYDPK